MADLQHKRAQRARISLAEPSCKTEAITRWSSRPHAMSQNGVSRSLIKLIVNSALSSMCLETSIFCPRRNSSAIVTASIRLFFGRILGDERPSSQLRGAVLRNPDVDALLTGK